MQRAIANAFRRGPQPIVQDYITRDTERPLLFHRGAEPTRKGNKGSHMTRSPCRRRTPAPCAQPTAGADVSGHSRSQPWTSGGVTDGHSHTTKCRTSFHFSPSYRVVLYLSRTRPASWPRLGGKPAGHGHHPLEPSCVGRLGGDRRRMLRRPGSYGWTPGRGGGG